MMMGRSVVFGSLIPCLVLLSPNLAAKKFELDDLRIRAELQPDGQLRVFEAITFIFDGRFRYAFRTFSLKPGESVSDIRVVDSGRSLIESSSGDPGTFQVRRSGRAVEVRWHFRARNEKRTFGLDYTVNGAVRKHLDTAELWWTFVGSGWSRPFRHIEARIEFASTISPSDLETRAWWLGSRPTRSQDPGDGSIVAVVENHPKRSSWEVRMVFSPLLVPDLLETSGVAALDRIVAETSGWELELQERMRRENEQREELARLAGRLLPWMAVLGLLGLSIWYLLYVQYGRPPESSFSPVPGEIPTDHSPVFAEYILHGRVGPRSMVTVLVDLASRGHLTIREEKMRKSGRFGSSEKLDYSFLVKPGVLRDLEDFERDLLEFCLQQAGQPHEFKMSALSTAAKKNRRAFHKWFRNWVKNVKQQGKALDIFERWSGGVIAMNLAVGVLLALAGGIVCAVSGGPAGVPAIVGGSLQAILTVALRRRTRKGQEWYFVWKDLRSLIRMRARATRTDSFNWENLDRLPVAATALGLDKELDRLPVLREGQAAMAPWFAAAASSGSTRRTGLGSMVQSISVSMRISSGVPAAR